jgi:hypothetical protein
MKTSPNKHTSWRRLLSRLTAIMGRHHALVALEILMLLDHEISDG